MTGPVRPPEMGGVPGRDRDPGEAGGRGAVGMPGEGGGPEGPPRPVAGGPWRPEGEAAAPDLGAGCGRPVRGQAPGAAPSGRPVRENRRELGRRAEELAARHLAALGYRIVARNVRCPAGEADLICREGGEWVVVEVRSRRRPARGEPSFGTPAQSVDDRKFRRLVTAGQWFLARAGVPEAPWRIDLVAVTWPSTPQAAEVPEITVFRRLEGGAQR